MIITTYDDVALQRMIACWWVAGGHPDEGQYTGWQLLLVQPAWLLEQK